MRTNTHGTTIGGAATALLFAGAGILLAGESAFTQSTTTCRNVDGIDKEICVVQGRIASNTTWGTGSYWVLRGAVFIEAPARLTIDAGTEIFGEFATNGTLIIARGAQILANGTAAAPIVFSSDQPIGERGRADWGGLIINGNAPINVPGSESVGEGDTGVYGGTAAADDSGHLRYVRVEFAGTEFSPDNELNGIAFQGVGSGTEVDHVMVKYNKDDGLEFFGGTVGVKHVVLQGIADDSIDWTDGWTGKGQFIIVMQSGDDADQGIEADNNGDNNNLTPRSNPTLYNLTLIGDPDTTEGSESDIGMLLREGTSATIRNFIVLGIQGGLRRHRPHRDVRSGRQREPDLRERHHPRQLRGERLRRPVPDRHRRRGGVDDDAGVRHRQLQRLVRRPHAGGSLQPVESRLSAGRDVAGPERGGGGVHASQRRLLRHRQLHRRRRTGRRRTRHVVAGVDRFRDQLTAFLRVLRDDTPRRPMGGVVYAFILTLALTACGAPPPLANPEPSSEALAVAVLDALADSDTDRLAALALNGQEFRDVVWPELPASRPERGVPVSYAWGDLRQKSSNALRRLVARWGGHRLTLLEVAYDGETTHYDTFRVHRETRLRVLDETGQEIEMQFYGSTLVRGAEYKVFSYIVD